MLSRVALGLALAAAATLTSALPTVAATGLVGYHQQSVAYCHGTGLATENNYIEVSAPRIDAYNAHPRTEDYQRATWRVQLFKWNSASGWVDTGQRTAWVPSYWVYDGQGTRQTIPLGFVNVWIPSQGYYAVKVEYSWIQSGTVSGTGRDLLWTAAAYESQIVWVDTGTDYCTYVPQIGSVQLP
jgi:hypothetical protein